MINEFLKKSIREILLQEGFLDFFEPQRGQENVAPILSKMNDEELFNFWKNIDPKMSKIYLDGKDEWVRRVNIIGRKLVGLKLENVHDGSKGEITAVKPKFGGAHGYSGYNRSYILIYTNPRIGDLNNYGDYKSAYSILSVPHNDFMRGISIEKVVDIFLKNGGNEDFKIIK